MLRFCVITVTQEMRVTFDGKRQTYRGFYELYSKELRSKSRIPSALFPGVFSLEGCIFEISSVQLLFCITSLQIDFSQSTIDLLGND